ncbi:hypothetical protein SNEBB_004589 [Seison nebaliae]|nr:hypothetical protein SNEBB_004589 [Seison nebaliae]
MDKVIKSEFKENEQNVINEKLSLDDMVREMIEIENIPESIVKKLAVSSRRKMENLAALQRTEEMIKLFESNYEELSSPNGNLLQKGFRKLIMGKPPSTARMVDEVPPPPTNVYDKKYQLPDMKHQQRYGYLGTLNNNRTEIDSNATIINNNYQTTPYPDQNGNLDDDDQDHVFNKLNRTTIPSHQSNLPLNVTSKRTSCVGLPTKNSSNSNLSVTSVCSSQPFTNSSASNSRKEFLPFFVPTPVDARKCYEDE